jgi:hypothetical protein
MIFYVALSLLFTLGMFALVLWNLRKAGRTILQAVAFNVGGGSPMARLVPNVAYLALFLLLLNATWF